MGMDDFAPGSSQYTSFVVKNITAEPKIISIFTYPILPNCTRDLLKIPGVSESDIRASLLKGTLRHKLLSQDIQIIYSDLDLLQFNSGEYAFLTQYGIIAGTTVTPAQTSGFPTPSGVGYTLQQNIQPLGIKNGSNRKFITPSFFINGAYQGNVFDVEVYHNGRRLISNIDFTISVTGRSVNGGFNTINIISFSPTASSELYVNYYVALV